MIDTSEEQGARIQPELSGRRIFIRVLLIVVVPFVVVYLIKLLIAYMGLL